MNGLIRNCIWGRGDIDPGLKGKAMPCSIFYGELLILGAGEARQSQITH